ncbi:DUF2169 family type VI secretion system accessory protein [Nannocystis pusilla]|uniref:DUF2169 family type VI secretion system accessory protein n=1 Tax=Nannocystis pusilla TaxID=889268 RepID=UPI003BF36EDF
MDNLVNLTPFAAAAMPSMDRHGSELILVVLAAHYRLPPAGRTTAASLSLCELQEPVVVADEYLGDPASSSLRREAQTAYRKPGTDIHLLGHAWAPRGRPVTRGHVALQVGSLRHEAVVFGERRWSRGLGGLRPTKPEPFERMPICYERCFGGPCGAEAKRLVEASERNPVGRGLVTAAREASDQPLPNFEDPHAPIDGPDDLPAPVGFGPLARHWSPRRHYAGTYDEAWVRRRAPHWPEDLDERFFCAAPEPLCATPHLRGDEMVRVEGAHPDGDLSFRLPAPRIQVKLTLGGRVGVARMVLDGLTIMPDDERCTMIWRAALPVQKDMATIETIRVRELEPWENGA